MDFTGYWPIALDGCCPLGGQVRSSTVWVIAGTLRGVAEENIPELVRVRLGKRERLLESGTEPYPVGFGRTATAAELRAGYGHLPPDTFTGEVVSVAGRVMLSRLGGKLCFATLRDGTGDIQVSRCVRQSGSDRDFPALTGRSGTQRARPASLPP